MCRSTALVCITPLREDETRKVLLVFPPSKETDGKTVDKADLAAMDPSNKIVDKTIWECLDLLDGR